MDASRSSVKPTGSEPWALKHQRLWMVGPLLVLGNVFLGKPRPLPLLLGEEGRLVGMVRRARVVGLRVGHDAVSRRRGSELHRQHVTVAAAGDEPAVLFLLVA